MVTKSIAICRNQMKKCRFGVQKGVLPKMRSKLWRKYPAPHNYQKPLHLCRSIYGEITTKVIACPVRSALTPLVSTQIERRTGDVSYSDRTAPAGRSLGQRAEQAVDGRRERAGLLLRSPRYGPLGFHFSWGDDALFVRYLRTVVWFPVVVRTSITERL